MKMLEVGIPSRWGTFEVMFSWYYTTCTDPSNLTDKIVTGNSRPFVSEEKIIQVINVLKWQIFPKMITINLFLEFLFLLHILGELPAFNLPS